MKKHGEPLKSKYEWIDRNPCHVEAKHGDLGHMSECETCGRKYLKKDE